MDSNSYTFNFDYEEGKIIVKFWNNSEGNFEREECEDMDELLAFLTQFSESKVIAYNCTKAFRQLYPGFKFV